MHLPIQTKLRRGDVVEFRGTVRGAYGDYVDIDTGATCGTINASMIEKVISYAIEVGDQVATSKGARGKVIAICGEHAWIEPRFGDPLNDVPFTYRVAALKRLDEERPVAALIDSSARVAFVDGELVEA